jgi:hypothetical protein
MKAICNQSIQRLTSPAAEQLDYTRHTSVGEVAVKVRRNGFICKQNEINHDH